jgi:hypothetical protein
VMIFQISYIPRAESDWAKSRLTVQGRDILYAMEGAGVDWSDEDEVSGFMEDAFNMTQVKYRLELVGAPSRYISVGCLCDGGPGCSGFCNGLDSMLPGPGQLSFNGLDTGFTVTETASINNIFDVMVSSQPLTGLDTAISGYLSGDRGFVLVRDLAPQDFSGYGSILRAYFAVDEFSGQGSGSVTFDVMELGEEPDYYRAARYFSSIPNGTGDRYNVTHVFEGFAADPVQRTAEGMTILKTFNNYPACIASWGVLSGLGRTAWISGGSTSLDDKEVMVTSLVLWSSRHRRAIASTDMNVEKTVVSMYRVPGNAGQPDYMFQPMEAVLTLGYLY